MMRFNFQNTQYLFNDEKKLHNALFNKHSTLTFFNNRCIVNFMNDKIERQKNDYKNY